MPLPAIIFDLDMTLLNTSALLAARSRQDWVYVRANLHLVQPFSFNPPPHVHEVPGLLHARGHKVAIVTSSPGWYAQALLQAFKVPYDALVAYEDTQQHKPHPEPLQEALRRLGVGPGSAYYVGDAHEDFAASYRAGVCSIGAGWSPSVADLWRTAPDILLPWPMLLLNPAELPRRGYIAEVLSAGLTPLIHPGSTLRCGAANRVALGRYMPTKDPRHAGHALSQLVLTLKNEDGPSALFGSALASALSTMELKPVFATCVPPKPSQPRIRFAATLQHLRSHVPHVAIYPDGMHATREVEDYKQAGYDDRADLVAGAFASKYTWGKNSVLLLDDVITSGATTNECSRVLTVSNAGDVHTVCLGADQHPFEVKSCPYCGRDLRTKTRRHDGRRFWGCSGWRRDGTGCNYTENY